MNEAYRTEGIVTGPGSIRATDLPFEPGERVELVVWISPAQSSDRNPSVEEISRRLERLDEMSKWFAATRPKDLPQLSDSALSRETIYQDRGA